MRIERDMPLTGIRVLDLTRLLPGAFCTMLLADMGADVIKVEEPAAGDYMRWTPPMVDGQSALFNALNRNKRSLTLNLKTDAGRDLLLRLVDRSAVLVEGNRPGVMERLGLGWPVLRARNPALVMCSITGYGQDGPLASHAGHDINYMATAGALGLNGVKGGPPLPLAVQVADIGGGGLQPAVAILGALVGVQRGDQGRWLDVSMTDGAVSWMALSLAQEGAGDPVVRGDQRLTGRYACYRVYECKGGGYFSVGALEPKFWTALCNVVGKPELIEVQYATGQDGAPVHQAMEAVFRSKTRSEWERELAGREVCCEPVLQVDEVAANAQIAARGLISRTTTGIEVRPAVAMRSDWRRLDPPGLGEHTAAILSELGVDAAKLESFKKDGVV
jgi:crotonobetainyl-CoA:carnitine CoA-transferase CaiB-like acyl-CoA transferase